MEQNISILIKAINNGSTTLLSEFAYQWIPIYGSMYLKNLLSYRFSIYPQLLKEVSARYLDNKFEVIDEDKIFQSFITIEKISYPDEQLLQFYMKERTKLRIDLEPKLFFLFSFGQEKIIHLGFHFELLDLYFLYNTNISINMLQSNKEVA